VSAWKGHAVKTANTAADVSRCFLCLCLEATAAFTSAGPQHNGWGHSDIRLYGRISRLVGRSLQKPGTEWGVKEGARPCCVKCTLLCARRQQQHHMRCLQYSADSFASGEPTSLSTQHISCKHCAASQPGWPHWGQAPGLFPLHLLSRDRPSCCILDSPYPRECLGFAIRTLIEALTAPQRRGCTMLGS
jgi:hypothetical protein